MKYPFHIVDVFSSTPFGGNQLAVLPDAAGISTEGMQKIAREFNFGETTLLFAGNLRDGGKLYARMWAPALGVEEDPATGSACAALVGAMASKPEFGGTAYRLSIQQGVSMGRRSEIEAEARKSGAVVTSVSVGGATAYIASGEIEVPPSALLVS